MDDFRKPNTSGFSDSLQCEAEGLRLLREALAGTGVSALVVPEVRSVSDHELVLPRIHTRPATLALMSALGEGLARLHCQRYPRYGLGNDNYIGLCPQQNRWSDDWGSFFRDDRLGFQVALIQDSAVKGEFERVLTRHGQQLADFLNAHCDQPSLLHGDLWSGNVLFDGVRVWLIDPAVYYGDREADLAMTEFFGGFSVGFYQAYDRVWRRTPEYRAKRDIYNLYHALNHYNLFGSSYLGRCRELLASVERRVCQP